MASGVRVKINSRAARALLNGPEVQGELLARAEKVKASAESMGSGEYVADVRPGKNRAHAIVRTTDIESRRSNAKHNSLVKGLNAGRGKKDGR